MHETKVTLTLHCGARVRMDPSKVYRTEPADGYTRVYYSGNGAKKSDCYAVKENVAVVRGILSAEKCQTCN